VPTALTQRGLTGRLGGGRQGSEIALIGEALTKPSKVNWKLIDEKKDQVRSTCQKHRSILPSQGIGKREVQEPWGDEHWPTDC
jgi:hypothetical protein